MPYQPTFLSLMPTYECNLSCAHCCVPEGAAGDMSLDLALGCVNEAASAGITSVGFTGGEPMLRVKWVAEVTRAATSLGLEVDDLSTNGVWWSSRSELESALLMLREAGFAGGFHLSVDAFHAGAGSEMQAEFVRASLKVFGKVGNIGCAESRGHSPLSALSQLAKRLGATLVEESPTQGHLHLGEHTISYGRFPAAAVGQRSASLVSTGDEWFGDFDCFGHDSVLLDPAGGAHFCTGFAGLRAAPLCVGDATREWFAGVLSAAAELPLVELLCAEGPAGLRRVIEARSLNSFPRPWASPCAFCYHCLTDERLLSILEDAGIVAA